MLNAFSSLHINDRQFAEAIEELVQFVNIPSVSNPSSPHYHLQHLHRAAEFVKERLSAIGFKARLATIQEGTAPYVLAEYISDPSHPTVLLYAHYDVQPVEESYWSTSPFQAIRKANRLYGRGASDDKAGVISILTALKAIQETGSSLPINVKILIEGEEEYGSANMADLLQKEADALRADALIILDGSNKDVHTGTLETATRGITTLELRVDALDKPVHSGIGCLAPDPCQALASLIVSLSNPRAIPGFMDDCQPLSSEETALLDQSSTSEESYACAMGVKKGAKLRGAPEESIYRRIVTEPSISIINMSAGQKGGGNSIQPYARCSIGVRLTPGQDPERIEQVIHNYLSSQKVPYNLPFSLQKLHLGAKAWKGNLRGPFTQAYLSALKKNYGQIATMPTGGALPFIADFEKAFPNLEIIIAGIEDPDTAAHSHNESQDLGVLRKTIDSLIAFLQNSLSILPKS